MKHLVFFPNKQVYWMMELTPSNSLLINLLVVMVVVS